MAATAAWLGAGATANFTPAGNRRAAWAASASRFSLSGRSRRHRLTRVRLLTTTSSSLKGDGAPIITPKRVLNAWVRAFTALARVTLKVRITSTGPDFALGVAVAVRLNTERAICSASSRSDLPSLRRLRDWVG